MIPRESIPYLREVRARSVTPQERASSLLDIQQEMDHDELPSANETITFRNQNLRSFRLDLEGLESRVLLYSSSGRSMDV